MGAPPCDGSARRSAQRVNDQVEHRFEVTPVLVGELGGSSAAVHTLFRNRFWMAFLFVT